MAWLCWAAKQCLCRRCSGFLRTTGVRSVVFVAVGCMIAVAHLRPRALGIWSDVDTQSKEHVLYDAYQFRGAVPAGDKVLEACVLSWL